LARLEGKKRRACQECWSSSGRRGERQEEGGSVRNARKSSGKGLGVVRDAGGVRQEAGESPERSWEEAAKFS